jgi:RimJ/RimL family protein N-acetyltransferase
VQLKTDALNVRSREAIKRLGAKEEGTLRKHYWVQNRRFRDSVYFSILDDEWPEVRARLEGWMERNTYHATCITSNFP